MLCGPLATYYETIVPITKRSFRLSVNTCPAPTARASRARTMNNPTRDQLIAAFEDLDRTIAAVIANHQVLATPVLLRRLDEIEGAARSLEDPVLIALLEKLRRQLVEGQALDG